MVKSPTALLQPRCITQRVMIGDIYKVSDLFDGKLYFRHLITLGNVNRDPVDTDNTDPAVAVGC